MLKGNGDKMKAKIKKIDFEIGDKKFSLTPAEAKELKKILNEMFGEDKLVYSPPVIVKELVPWVQPTYPYRWWDVGYGDSTGTITICNTTTENTLLDRLED